MIAIDFYRSVNLAIGPRLVLFIVGNDMDIGQGRQHDEKLVYQLSTQKLLLSNNFHWLRKV